jgi:hypothetical protein
MALSPSSDGKWSLLAEFFWDKVDSNVADAGDMLKQPSFE